MLKELLKDHQLYHSEFQQDYYITGSGGTLYGQYKQCLRELYKRFRGLREAYCDREKLQVEIDEQHSISMGKSGFEQKYANIEWRRKTMQMEECERLIVDTEREFTRFYQQAIHLKGQLGELTEEKRRQLDEEMHIFKLKERIVTDKICSGSLSASTYDTLMTIPVKYKNEILAKMADKNEGLVEWYEKQDKDYFKDFKEIEVDIKQCLLEM